MLSDRIGIEVDKSEMNYTHAFFFLSLPVKECVPFASKTAVVSALFLSFPAFRKFAQKLPLNLSHETIRACWPDTREAEFPLCWIRPGYGEDPFIFDRQ